MNNWACGGLAGKDLDLSTGFYWGQGGNRILSSLCQECHVVGCVRETGDEALLVSQLAMCPKPGVPFRSGLGGRAWSKSTSANLKLTCVFSTAG